MVDEKGMSLLAAFGLPPLSHEDDPFRAIQAAREMQNELDRRGFKANYGAATGRVFCGLIGSAERREYAVIGMAVNLAARLAQYSEGKVFCDEETFRSCVSRMQFAALPPMRLKGMPKSIPVFSPAGPAAKSRAPLHMVGHQQELQSITAAIDRIGIGEAFIGIIEGEAGIGKSTLVKQWSEGASSSGMSLLIGAAESVHAATPYFVWGNILETLFELPGTDSAEARRKRFLEISHGTTWERLAPLLGDVLEIALPDNAMTAQITGKMRADNTRLLITNLIAAEALRKPLGIVLEDCHWMDSASLDVAAAVAECVRPIVMLLTSRILTGERQLVLDNFRNLPGAHWLRLEPLNREDCVALAAQRLCVGQVAEPIAELIVAKS
jgi:hypothetical protein